MHLIITIDCNAVGNPLIGLVCKLEEVLFYHTRTPSGPIESNWRDCRIPRCFLSTQHQPSVSQSTFIENVVKAGGSGDVLAQNGVFGQIEEPLRVFQIRNRLPAPSKTPFGRVRFDLKLRFRWARPMVRLWYSSRCHSNNPSM